MLKQTEVNKIKKWGKKFFNDDDYQTFDFDAEIDRAISYEENLTILRQKIKNFINIYRKEVMKETKMTRKEAEIMPNEQYEILAQQHLEKAEKQAELEFTKTLKKIEETATTNIIETIYYIPKQFSKMVANGNSRGFILYGEAGLGKTYSVMKAFTDMGKPFVMLSGHITSLELYHFLYEHRAEHIVLDDVNVLESEQNLNMLKACLNEENRIVQYHTSSKKLKYPTKFVFEGTITLILNSIPHRNESLEAVKSRVLSYELKLDYETKMKVLCELSKQGYKDLSDSERRKIMGWLKENTTRATKNLSLRLLFQIYEMFRFDKREWRRMASKIVETDEELYLILQGLTPTEWCEQTGKSRRTYFNYKKECKSATI